MTTNEGLMQGLRPAQDGIPDYLGKHYWWAYLWPFSRAFFDHPAIISAILFGHYRELREATIAQLTAVPVTGRTLQLTCVYGDLTPRLQEVGGSEPLHLTDVATLQLDLARKKSADRPLKATRMNVEQLAYRSDSFENIIIFFLLHELPPEARQRVLRESLRVLKPGGRIILTEYAPTPQQHLLYRNPITRYILKRSEPFLASFWEEDTEAFLAQEAQRHDGQITLSHQASHFNDFYRIQTFRYMTN